MIMINNQWEQINDIDDVKRIIEENLSKELADKIPKDNSQIWDGKSICIRIV